jgi:CubicO group peptidase (beta-lactamase class C family)
LKYFDAQKSLIVAYEDNDASNLSAANVLFGGLPALGKLPVSASEKYRVGNGFISDTILRLQISLPEEVGMKTEDLRELDDIVINGIIGHAYPGCQVLVAKDGKVIWNKSYGNKVYENSLDKVSVTDLYDLASITKIAATTLSVMKLYDEGKLDLNKTVGDYLQLPEDATIKDLKIGDVLTHNAGLKPFIEFFRNTIDTNYNNFYRTSAEKGFSTPVAENLFIRNDYADTMWAMMYRSPIKPNPEFVYSDIDFYILQKVVESITKQKLEDYVQQSFYMPMGLTRIDYKPLTEFPKKQIIPTENDKLFRKQLLQGYVHDPGAAMYGGVAGHAGLFSNAFDLAQVMQLLLNKGTYNGKQFFKASTVEKFTERFSSRSRRGLGFDKPEPDSRKQSPCFDEVPLSVFGHTGFTGTCVWTDPENKLTFIFLSNRVYPDADNPRLVKMGVRVKLQQVVYKAMGKQRLH